MSLAHLHMTYAAAASNPQNQLSNSSGRSSLSLFNQNIISMPQFNTGGMPVSSSMSSAAASITGHHHHNHHHHLLNSSVAAAGTILKKILIFSFYWIICFFYESNDSTMNDKIA